jgi:hypothetical protein
MEDLHDGLKLHSPSAWDSLDLILGRSSDAQVHQQSLKPTGRNRSLNPKVFKLLDIAV